MSRKVALIQGGLSSESQVSLASGKAFEKALKELGENYIIIEADEKLPEKLMKHQPDVALLALHGKYAEDGTVQGICEYLKIPYTGSGVLASALCFNKLFTKQVLAQNSIPTPDFELIDLKNRSLDSVKTKISAPMVVKPSRDGSSMGISICKTEEDFSGAVIEASKYDQQILVEDFVEGKEVTIPMLLGKALSPIEIVPKTEFYNYKNKYTAGQTDYYVPARIDAEALESCQKMASKVYEVLNIRTYCRVDFMLDSKMNPYVLEVNTLPGFTETSLFPRSAKHDGIAFTELIKTLIDSAGLDYEGLK
ncbi:MAG: D-alanine--D-alanine ligase [Bdellovibrionales bacterium]|nr:D-alanine--D-alanine ligase [Bdellovibrionales bacterium]